jgi:cytochrome c oxidase subunit 1
VFGYTAMVLALVSTGFLAFGLWVHHMFAGPMPQVGQSFFTAASMIIAIPTGIQIFCWIATIWDGRPRWQTPMLFIVGFIVLFMIGGVTGVMIASVPFDLQVHDSFFIVAHLHYVLVGGAVCPLIGAIYFWWPKITGRMMSERAGKWNFWLFVIGVNLTFFPMHQLGLDGMPRRIYTYAEQTGWGSLNSLASIGSLFIVASFLTLIGNAIWSLRRGRMAGPDPWGGDTLEWATTSPPAPYNRVRVPVVRSRSPLWAPDGELPVVTGLDPTKREVLVTTMLDAVPDSRHEEPGDSIWPLIAALATGAMFIISVYTPWGLVIGAALLLPAMFGWLWPRPLKRAEHEVVELPT